MRGPGGVHGRGQCGRSTAIRPRTEQIGPANLALLSGVGAGRAEGVLQITARVRSKTSRAALKPTQHDAGDRQPSRGERVRAVPAGLCVRSHQQRPASPRRKKPPSLGDDERVAGEDDGDVVAPTSKRAAFEVVEAELAFHLFVGLFGSPPLHQDAHDLLFRRAPRQRGEHEFRRDRRVLGATPSRATSVRAPNRVRHLRVHFHPTKTER